MPTAARRKCREIAAAATARRRALGLEGEGEGLEWSVSSWSWRRGAEAVRVIDRTESPTSGLGE